MTAPTVTNNGIAGRMSLECLHIVVVMTYSDHRSRCLRFGDDGGRAIIPERVVPVAVAGEQPGRVLFSCVKGVVTPASAIGAST